MDFTNWAAAFCVVSTGFHFAGLAVTAARFRRDHLPVPSPSGEPAVSLTSPDSRVYLSALRAARRFRPSDTQGA
jgi:hypothetical protein